MISFSYMALAFVTLLDRTSLCQWHKLVLLLTCTLLKWSKLGNWVTAAVNNSTHRNCLAHYAWPEYCRDLALTLIKEGKSFVSWWTPLQNLTKPTLISDCPAVRNDKMNELTKWMSTRFPFWLTHAQCILWNLLLFVYSS